MKNPDNPDKEAIVAIRPSALPAWAMGGVVAGFSGFEADGALVCMDLDVSLTPGVNDAISEAIDLNGDGTNDLLMVVNTNSTADLEGHNGQVTVAGLSGAEVAGEPSSIFQRFYPTAYYPGASINSGLHFDTRIGRIAWSSSRQGLGSAGDWYGGADAYLGVKFEIGGFIHYGWVHLIWDADLNTLTIAEVAYEDVASFGAVIPAPPGPPGLSIMRAAPPDDQTVELRWPVHCGYTYELERSDDLSPTGWTTIYTTTATTDGEEVFVDTDVDVDVEVKSFYRVNQSASPLLLLALGRRRGAGRMKRKA